MSSRFTLVTVLPLLCGCSAPSPMSPSTSAPAPSRPQALTDLWLSPSSVAAKGNDPQRPVWDGTTFWVVTAMTYGDPFDSRDVLRRFDGTGQPVDDGGIRIDASGAKLIRVGGVMIALSIANTADSGIALVSQPLATTGLLGAPRAVHPLPLHVAGDRLNWRVASTADDSRALIRDFDVGGVELVTELIIDSAGALARPAVVWPSTSTALNDLHFDGVRFLALVTEPDGGMALMGLSGPSGEGRFYRPITPEISARASLAGDSTLGAVMTATQVQLTSDAQPSGARIAFNRPRTAFRDGSELVILSDDSPGSFRGMTAARVTFDGGVGTPFVVEPPDTSPVFFYTPSFEAGPAAVSGSTALIPWQRSKGGNSVYVSAIALSSNAVSPRLPLSLLPALTHSEATVIGTDTPLSVWVGEMAYHDEEKIFAQRLGPDGGVGATITVAQGRVGLANYNGNSLGAARLGSEWLVAYTPTFSVNVRRIADDGSLPDGAPTELNTNVAIFSNASVASGAGIYFVAAARIGGSVIGFRVSATATRLGSELALNTGSFAETRTAFDGTDFHVLSQSSQGLQWVTVTPAGAVAPMPTLEPARGLLAANSGNGYALAAWSSLGTSGTTHVARLFSTGTTANLATVTIPSSTSLAVIESDIGTHLAAGSPTGLVWFDLSADGGVRESLLFAGQSTVLVGLQRIDGGVLLVRSPTSPSPNLHVDAMRFRPSGAVCGDDLDCGSYQCLGGTCCPACTAPVDAGVADAGSPDAGATPDAGVADAGLSDGGQVADAGPQIDAGVQVDGGGAVDGGGWSDAGVTMLDSGVALTPQPALVVGCSCDGSAQGLTWVGLALLAVLARRQRRRAR